MNEADNFTLVPTPPGALEKAEPDRRKRNIIRITAMLFILAGLLPPWVRTLDVTGETGTHSTHDAGYGFILTPPPLELNWDEQGLKRFYSVKLDVTRVLIEWTCILAGGVVAWVSLVSFVPRDGAKVHQKDTDLSASSLN
jgi:hypothetical protein